MSTASLPDRPNIEQLRNQARELQRSTGITLNEAQLQLARSYGFASWTKLKIHVELVTSLTRTPDEVASEDFAALACLHYGNDSADRYVRAAALVAADPSLVSRDIWSAASAASADGVRAHLARARDEGGPFGWEPLMYLTYSRMPSSEADVLACANLLLDAGADPNVGYLWHGLPTPFTALTGAFGQGEQGPVAQPEHPHWRALARLLLSRGANANDGQALYNRMFVPGTAHLELLYEFGLGEGDGGPWRPKLGDALETIDQMMERQMRWSVLHELTDRIELLSAHGVPNNVAPPTALLIQAAALGRIEDVRRLVSEGWDVNALGRGDIFTDEPWQTALHAAVEHNDAPMVTLLLKLGADPSIEDARFHSTPLGWAQHFGHTNLLPLLSP